MSGELFPSTAAAQLEGKSPISDVKSRAGRPLKAAVDGARNGLETTDTLTTNERGAPYFPWLSPRRGKAICSKEGGGGTSWN